MWVAWRRMRKPRWLLNALYETCGLSHCAGRKTQWVEISKQARLLPYRACIRGASRAAAPASGARLCPADIGAPVRAHDPKLFRFLPWPRFIYVQLQIRVWLRDCVRECKADLPSSGNERSAKMTMTISAGALLHHSRCAVDASRVSVHPAFTRLALARAAPSPLPWPACCCRKHPSPRT
jgi:hypothetical protein